ncbi:hypothetical protein SALGADO_22 [Arthrobacter phage Salgado]|uniref:Uncharacterized protein n=3 Tax=Laroyevirus TaxID=1982086 RepID=A0A0U4B652_9CAUD|nr:hypothetical protein FDH64_gp22 [Arthrobacter phage Laroye]YP_010082534.1 hypothetical protein KMD21_gp21 [Arthrobacter phage LiSara]YP_010082631.1 hypothetical protein KMD22_gp22 [Arthrobacter phage Salgado]ALY09549.1 hypothetical protein LAROYE_22 [Arthrobacter phage Laroye]ALY10190.1 hypothetical protein SALGADO_22 [Arthrobacter phage Salgado]ASR83605.1 hypothetical protein SEA_LISARA_21 [Arthrobacter phage LiSara]
MANSGYMCQECWTVPVNYSGGYCDACREAYWVNGGWEHDDGVWSTTSGDPWCAKCNNRKVYFKGDWCDDCLPPLRGSSGRSYSHHGSRLPATWTVPKAKPIRVPNWEDEVTFIPAVRGKVTT